MLYISFLSILFILIFNYKLLLYIGICYLIKIMIDNCIYDGYWLNSTDMCLRLFGNCLYILNYIIYIYRDSYLITNIKYIYEMSYIYLSDINLTIDTIVKRNIFM